MSVTRFERVKTAGPPSSRISLRTDIPTPRGDLHVKVGVDAGSVLVFRSATVIKHDVSFSTKQQF